MGPSHGFELFPDENERLDQLGMANLDEIERAVATVRDRLLGGSAPAT